AHLRLGGTQTLGLEARSIDSLADEVRLYGCCSLVRQRLVRGRVTDIVGMAFDRKLQIRMILQHAHDFLERRSTVRLDDIRPDVKENALRGDASISDQGVVQLLPPGVDRNIAEE